MTSAPNLNEMIAYSELLKEGFNPSSVEDLHALLYLIYFDYKYNQLTDPAFSNNLMGLIENCKDMYCQANHPQEEPCCCPPPSFDPNPNRYEGPCTNKNAQDFVQFGVQRLFYEGNQRIHTDVLGREMRRLP